ncbi:selenoprotein W [Bufo gargarizans]|uniref:selenoprotein W n=1 Tax=Bufo gargarizans TaxID=30331 RepID=UPI001CF4CD10|nr:selenoprotein W [Bufo gargarizans]
MTTPPSLQQDNKRRLFKGLLAFLLEGSINTHTGVHPDDPFIRALYFLFNIFDNKMLDRWYRPKFQQLKKELEKRFPGLLRIDGEGTPTSTGKFEVSINGKLVHSKKNGDGFVDSSVKLQKIEVAIQAAMKGC